MSFTETCFLWFTDGELKGLMKIGVTWRLKLFVVAIAASRSACIFKLHSSACSFQNQSTSLYDHSLLKLPELCDGENLHFLFVNHIRDFLSQEVIDNCIHSDDSCAVWCN
jgi:hypothetical protein